MGVRIGIVIVLLCAAAALAPVRTSAQEPKTGDQPAAASEARVQQLEEKMEAQQRIIEELLAQVISLSANKKGAPVSLARPGEDAETTRLRQAAAEEKQAAFDALPERVAKLEKDDAKQQGQMSKLGDGLKFNSGDGNWEGYVGGRVRVQLRNFADRPSDGGRTNPDSFFMREIRLETGGTFFQDFEYKVQYDAPTGGANIAGTLQDAYLGWKHYPWASLRLGQDKEPFSQEQTTSGRFIDFNERSVLDRLVPGRDIGASLYGKFYDDMFEYQAGVYNGAGRAVLDTNDEKEFAARLRIFPFLKTDIDLLKGLRIGAAGTVGAVDDQPLSGLNFTTTELGVNFLNTTATVGTIDGLRSRVGVELSWLYDSFSVRGEWVKKADWVARIPPPAGRNDRIQVEQEAWYVAATWLITGERKALETRVTPLHPFNIGEGTWGAVELAFRVADLQIDDSMFDAGIASRIGQANEVMTYTAGINWWLTKNVRFSTDFIDERFNHHINFGSRARGERESTEEGVLSRFQIDF